MYQGNIESSYLELEFQRLVLFVITKGLESIERVNKKHIFPNQIIDGEFEIFGLINSFNLQRSNYFGQYLLQFQRSWDALYHTHKVSGLVCIIRKTLMTMMGSCFV